MISTITKFLADNGYHSKGIENRFRGLTFCAETTNHTSGIIKIGGNKFYYHCIKPWAMCPEGRVEVEVVY